jgi:hypothetical protein
VSENTKAFKQLSTIRDVYILMVLRGCSWRGNSPRPLRVYANEALAINDCAYLAVRAKKSRSGDTYSVTRCAFDCAGNTQAKQMTAEVIHTAAEGGVI